MERITYTTTINAPKEKVWNILWDDETYRKWTSAFHEGSYAESDWNEGSKILFLGPGGVEGMVARIAEKRDNEYMSFEHLGMMKNGVEDTTSDEVKGWAGARENYTLKENNGVTELTIDMESTENYKEYFEKTWPVALGNVKRLAEE